MSVNIAAGCAPHVVFDEIKWSGWCAGVWDGVQVL